MRFLKYNALMTLMLSLFMANALTFSFADGGGDGGDPGGGDGGDPGGGDPGGGGGNEFTMETLKSHAPEDMRDNPIWDKYKSPEEYFNGVLEQAAFVGKRGDIPTDPDDADAWNAFYGKIGKPESVDGYELSVPEDFEIGNQEYVAKVAEVAHKHNLTKRQAEGFFADMMEYEKGLAGDARTLADDKKLADQGILTKEWGDKFQEMSVDVRALMGQLKIPEDAVDAISGNPHMMIALGKIAGMVGERGQGGGSAFGSTRAGYEAQVAELDSEISQIMAETNGNRRDPRIVSRLEKRDQLQDKLNAD